MKPDHELTIFHDRADRSLQFAGKCGRELRALDRVVVLHRWSGCGDDVDLHRDEALAAQAGTSRTVLAERFAHFIGQPPAQYLMQWRMQLAARMLAEPGAKVAAVAHAVGYESEATFSRAFERCTGKAPGHWRRRTAL